MRKYVVLGTAVAVGAALVGRQRRRSTVDKRRSEHVSQSEVSYRNARTCILILGAGFGGLATASRAQVYDVVFALSSIYVFNSTKY
ncbi:MAG: hypothetical protein ACJ788_01380 [Ktedonobacteraceae bacterium]